MHHPTLGLHATSYGHGWLGKWLVSKREGLGHGLPVIDLSSHNHCSGHRHGLMALAMVMAIVVATAMALAIAMVKAMAMAVAC